MKIAKAQETYTKTNKEQHESQLRRHLGDKSHARSTNKTNHRPSRYKLPRILNKIWQPKRRNIKPNHSAQRWPV